jgi:hypothetical protein
MSDYYKKIADGDPGGDLTAAYEAMRAETISAPSQGEYRVTMTTMANRLGRDAARRIYAGFKAAVAAGQMDDWELAQLNDKGFDINNPETATAVTALFQAGVLTQSDATALLNIAESTEPKYPGLEIGHLQNAREMRERGDI